MCMLSLNIPEEVLLTLHEDKNEFKIYAARTIALDLYKNKKVSLGYCANIAEMTKEDFIHFLGENGVSIFSFTDEEEFLEEIHHA